MAEYACLVVVFDSPANKVASPQLKVVLAEESSSGAALTAAAGAVALETGRRVIEVNATAV